MSQPGWLLYVVEDVAGLESLVNSMPPLPWKVKDDVSSWLWVGKRKTREQVLGESDDGMSKLKMDEMVLLTVPS